MKKLLTKLVSLARGSIAVVALFAATIGFSIPAEAWDKFDTSKTYVIDASACTWLEDDGTRLQVSENNGGTWNKMTRISKGIYAYKPTSSTDWLKFKRVYSSGSDNEFGYNCRDGQSAYTYLKIKSDCSGVESQSPVRIAGQFITTGTWGDNQKYMSWDEGQQAYSYTASSNGNFMVSTNSTFWNGRLKLTDGSKDIPSSKPSSANLTTSDSGDMNITEAGTIYFQPFADKIWYKPSKDEPVSTYNYAINYQNESGSWTMTSDQSMEASGSHTFTINMKTGSEFQIKSGSVYYGPGTNGTKVSNGTFSAISQGGNKFAWDGGNGQVKITLTLKSDGTPATIKLEGPAVVGGGSAAPASLYLRTNWNNWDDANAYRMRWNATAKTFTCDFDYSANGDFKFHFIEKRNSAWSAKGTVLYPDGNPTSISKDSPLTIPNVGPVSGDPNKCWEYKNSTSEKIRVIVDFSGSTPTVTITKATETPKPHLAGNIYLLGTMLNDNVASPAWQMIPQGDGTYLIEDFSMRFTENKKNDNNPVTFGVCKFNKDGVKEYPLTLTYDQVKNLNVPTPQANGAQVRDYYAQPGWAYRAIYDENKKTLTFEPMDGGNFEPMKNVMPYIGILGTNFKQSVTRETRVNFGNSMGNTDLGWQEAYIEYGPGEQPLFNAEGIAYYNTVWPPKNNILMISDVGDGVDPIPVSSSRLTMNRDNDGDRKKGSEWKSYLTDQKNNDWEEYKNLQLDDNTTYVRFTAPNMWMLGEFKIWTGWSGEKVSWGALWDRHVYWGPANKSDGEANNDRNAELTVHKTLGTSFESNNYYTPKENNKYTRSYYRTLEIFIPVNMDGNGNATGINFTGAKIYATEADGGAQIDALAKGKKVGYNPTLATEIPAGYRVKEYKITRYAFEANVPVTEYADKFVPVDRNRRTADKNGAACVASGSPENWTQNSQFNNFFTSKMSADDVFGGKYINDENADYAEGKYIFRLEVTFVDTEGGGKTKYADVWSPRVEIIDTEYKLNAYPRQLIRLEGDVPASIKNEFNYITYNPSMNGKLVKIEEIDGKEVITKVDNADLPVEKTREIYSKTGTWTNFSAIISTLPLKFLNDGVNREVTTYRATRKIGSDSEGDSESVDLKNIQGTNFYAALYHNYGNINTVPFTVDFQGEITKDDNTTITTEVISADIEYTPTFPIPYLGTPKFELVDHDKNGAWSDKNFSDLNEWTFTHEDVGNGAQNNKNAFGYELKLTVPVEMPNISPVISDAVYAKLNNLKVKHNETSYSVSVANTGGTRAIVYRNQSPYNWLSPDDTSEYFWKADEHKYAIDGSYDDVDTYRPYAATPVDAKLDPNFVRPSSTFKLYGELYGTEGEYFNPEDYNNFPHQRVIHARLYLKELNHGEMAEGAESSLNTDLALESGDKNVYVFHLRNNETSEDTKVDAGFIFNSQESTFTSADNGKGMVIFEGANFYPQSGETGMQIADRIGDWMRNIEIEIGQAHMFDATNENAESGYVGLSGDFPTVEKTESNVTKAPATHEAAGQDSGYRRGSTGTESKVLKVGDSAYLFSPIYKYAKITDKDIATGIEGIMTDGNEVEPVYYNLQGVRVENPGKGLYIKVTGNRTEKVIL